MKMSSSQSEETATEEKLSQQEYNRRYYKRHKDRINERRKQRYHNDPEYRERIKENMRKHRARKKMRDRKLGRRKGMAAPKHIKVNMPSGDSVTVKMWYVGASAEHIGVQPDTVRRWIYDRVIPDVHYRTDAGYRLFTDDQVRIMKEIYSEVSAEGRPDLEEFSARVMEAFDELEYGVENE